VAAPKRAAAPKPMAAPRSPTAAPAADGMPERPELAAAHSVTGLVDGAAAAP
jgi:hypothetical protein